MAWTLGGPVVIPKLVDGRNKLFFFANYSYVNDYIPGKNQGTQHDSGERGAAQRRLLRSAEAAEPGAVSDLRSADGAPRSGEPEPVHPRSVPEQHHSGEPDRESAVQPVQADAAEAEPELRGERDDAVGATTTSGGQPDVPKSTLYGGRVDYNMSDNDRIFVRGSKNSFIEAVNDWTYEVPTFAGLHSIDRSRPHWTWIGNWTHASGTTVIDTPGGEQSLLPGRPARSACTSTSRPTWGCRRTWIELCDVAGQLHAAGGQHRRLSGDRRRGAARSTTDAEPPGHGERHERERRAHAARRRRCAAGAA